MRSVMQICHLRQSSSRSNPLVSQLMVRGTLLREQTNLLHSSFDASEYAIGCEVRKVIDVIDNARKVAAGKQAKI